MYEIKHLKKGLRIKILYKILNTKAVMLLCQYRHLVGVERTMTLLVMATSKRKNLIRLGGLCYASQTIL